MPESTSPPVPPHAPTREPGPAETVLRPPAPRFTVVVPAHGVAGRLGPALDSVLAQSLYVPVSSPAADPGPPPVPLGLEVIPVPGAPDSPDAAVAERYAHRDPRVRPVCSPPDAGLAGARNAGLAAASGDYVVFLDGDDTLVPGALAAVAHRLTQTGDVDVLYTGHERVHWWRGTLPGGPADGPPAEVPADGAFTPDDAPGLSGTELPAWSAVHRRAFLAAYGIGFPAGWYTDLAFGGLELLAARRVAVLRRVCVQHLVRRQGNRLREPGAHHFDLLGQADLVLTSARGRAAMTGEDGRPLAPLNAPRLATLFTHLTAQLLRTAAAAPELLPNGGRGPKKRGVGSREFFARAAELYQYHRPDGYRPPPGRIGAQHRLLATGSYRTFAALRGARRQAARAGGKAAAGAARLRSGVPRRTAYAAALRRPVDETLAVYCAYWGRGYACNPAAIHAAARRLAPHLRGVFLVTEEAARRMPQDVPYAVLGTPEAWELLGRAKYLVNNANFANSVIKRPGTVHLQTQHGTPLKRMGLEQAEYPVVAAQSGSFAKLLHRIDRWDYNLSSNPHSTQVWEREFPAGYEMLEYGYPRNDAYQTATADDVAAIRAQLGVPEGRTALLYAPTHRDYLSGPEGALLHRARLDLAEFCRAAGDEFVVLLRAHYFYADGEPGSSDAGIPAALRGRLIDVTRHPSAEEVCLAADALVTDYSSIMFDYANLDRPIVVYADDWDVYRETRGVTFDITAEPPGPVARTPQELARVFRDGTWSGARSARLRAAFRERFCPWDDGFAAERVVRRVLLGEPPEALPPVVPLAERTPAPAASATPADAPLPLVTDLSGPADASLSGPADASLPAPQDLPTTTEKS